MAKSFSRPISSESQSRTTSTRWGFAQENSLLLPDEYDRIHLDLAPFWALPRTEMRKRVREAMDVKETFVLIVENGTVSVEVSSITAGIKPRAQSLAMLMLSPLPIGPGHWRTRLGWDPASCERYRQVSSS